jgi:hypothetical protein
VPAAGVQLAAGAGGRHRHLSRGFPARGDAQARGPRRRPSDAPHRHQPRSRV